MTADEFGGVLRTLAAAAGGWIVGSGIFTASDWTAISGGIVVVGVAIWSWWQKKQAAKKLEAAKK